MGLAEYHRKRDFGKTPEPKGETSARPVKGFSFVVQKHAATRLHYDFRLELDGVLLSWAVPKGPSFDPVEKRLAMQTEDHPLEYGTFEGVIAKGQYGGGTVLLWDHGTWTPVEDPARGLLSGKLKFRLEGEKLRGGWTLVKIRGRGARDAEKSWLLIKERDETARPAKEYDVTEERPESVATGRDMQAIAEERDAVWESNRPEEGTARKRAPVKLASPAGLAGARRAALPRSLQPQLPTPAKSVPEGEEWLHEQEFDGHRALCRIEGGRARLVGRDGEDWTDHHPAIARVAARLPVKAALLDGEVAFLLPNGTTSLAALEKGTPSSAAGRVVYFAFDLLHRDGYDLRRVPLEARKADLERVLAAAGAGAGPLRYSDHVVGAGQEFYRHGCRLSLGGVISKHRDARYEPGPTRSWRKVKCAHEVVEGRARASAAGEAVVAALRLTHPERVLYPSQGITKLALAEFYEGIAEWILPEVADRPTTLVRCPEGLKKECFYQKHVPVSAPPALRRVKIQEKKKVGEYLVVDDVAGLVSLVQIGILEIHTWNSRASRLERPDRLVFDLDPAPGLAWGKVVLAARLVRARLLEEGLESFVKTTGGKGLHVVAPLLPGASWEACAGFARGVAEAIVREQPRAYTANMSKAARPGKVFIDYLRNVRGATSVAAYSTRAREAATVSTPLAWEELDARLRPEQFTVKSLPKRLAALEEDPWGRYAKLRQALPSRAERREVGAGVA